MRSRAAGTGTAMLVALMVALALFAAPALAGNTVTITGEVLVAVPPIADFSADPTSGTAPLAVQFSDLSTGAINSWAWDFDNDGTVDSTDQNPVFTYSSPGTYTVALTITGPGGQDTKVRTDYISISDPVRKPVALFIQDRYIGTAPLTVKFTDRSLYSPTSWTWSYRQGTGSWTQFSTEQNPQYTFTQTGIYVTRLDISNAAGTSTAYGGLVVLRSSWLPDVDFTADVTEGGAPLSVQFTDLSTRNPYAWQWDFGDGTTSTVQNPVHTYETPGIYTVTLQARNILGSGTLTKADYIHVAAAESFADFIVSENVFVYGDRLKFSGNTVNGPGATMVITGGLQTSDLNGGASVQVSDISIDGDVTLNGGSASLGSPSNPGDIHVNGDLTLGSGARNIYGDVYVNGDMSLKDARIHGTVYVDGDLTLDWTPWLANDARIYYTGKFTHPAWMSQAILAKCIHLETVPGVEMPDQEIAEPKPADWYAARGYVSSGTLTSNLKIYAPSYTSTSWRPSATDVVIVVHSGDITITGLGGSKLTGVLYAPHGKVTFGGGSFEGVVIARDGFFVTSGGTTVTYANPGSFFSGPDDYPF